MVGLQCPSGDVKQEYIRAIYPESKLQSFPILGIFFLKVSYKTSLQIQTTRALSLEKIS